MYASANLSQYVYFISLYVSMLQYVTVHFVTVCVCQYVCVSSMDVSMFNMFVNIMYVSMLYYEYVSIILRVCQHVICQQYVYQRECQVHHLRTLRSSFSTVSKNVIPSSFKHVLSFDNNEDSQNYLKQRRPKRDILPRKTTIESDVFIKSGFSQCRNLMMH